MQKIKFVTDSISDITKADEKKLGIKIMSIPVEIDKSVRLERLDFSPDEFYRTMDNSKTEISVSSVPANEILDLYNELYSEGWTDVIFVTASSSKSGTYRNALTAAQKFKENVHTKDRLAMRIFVIDSRSYSAAYGYAVVQAALLAQKGATPDELLDFIHDYVDNCELYLLPLTFKNIKKAEIVTSAAAFFGKMLKKYPVIKAYGGLLSSSEKIHGEKNIIPGFSEYVQRIAEAGTPYTILCGSNRKAAEDLATELRNRLGYPPESIVKFSAALACIIGHNSIGIAVHKTRHK